MDIVGSLWAKDSEISNEVEEEVEDQVEEQGSSSSEDEVEEVDQSEDHPETEATEEAEEASDEAPAKPRNMVPGGAIKAERQKRQEAERKAAEYKQEVEKLRNANRSPDQYSDDPYFNEFREKMRAEVFEERLFDSDEMAREKYGDEAVAEAAEWAKSRMVVDEKTGLAADPTLRTKFLASRKPMMTLVEQYQKDQKVSAILTDEEAYIRRRAAELGLLANASHSAASETEEVAPAAVIKTNTAKPLPRRGLAGGQSQGRATERSSEGSLVYSLWK